MRNRYRDGQHTAVLLRIDDAFAKKPGQSPIVVRDERFT
jgi:hypothetical protein